MPGINQVQVALADKLVVGIKRAAVRILHTDSVQNQLEKIGMRLRRIDQSDIFNKTDDLTGLLTRSSFLACLAELERTESPTAAVVFIDLDRFKPINDEYGHDVGDILLVQLSERLRRVMTCVGRHGGDEFVGILNFEAEDRYKDLANLHEKMSEILDEIKRPYEFVPGNPQSVVSIQASLGARILTKTADPEAELREADMAMYHAKRQGGEYTVFSEEVRSEARRHGADSRHHMVSESANSVTMKYQLIYSLRTCDVAMAEASLFVPGISTEYFMSNVERRSSINRPLFLRTFEEACRDAAGWPRNASGQRIVLSFNLPIELLDRNLKNSIIDIMERVGVSGRQIQFELLERGKLLGNTEAKQNIDMLRSHGVAFYLDDVGEKNANIEIIDEYERHLKGLKIGTTFTLKMVNDLKKRGLVETLLIMADKLDKEAVVEGIETLAALEVVIPFDPPFLQGYLLHRPEDNGPALHAKMTQKSQACQDAKPDKLIILRDGYFSEVS